MSSIIGTVAFSTDSNEAARRPLEAGQCALIVVDIQEKLLPPIFNKEAMVKNSQLLIRLAKVLSIPAMVTTQYSRGLGETVPDIASLLPDVRAIDKLEFGCFGSDLFPRGAQVAPRQSQYRVAVRDGSPHLRDADGARRAERWVHSAHRVRRSGLACRVELADRAGPHARGRGRDLFHGNDDVRTAALFRHAPVQGNTLPHQGITAVSAPSGNAGAGQRSRLARRDLHVGLQGAWLA